MQHDPDLMQEERSIQAAGAPEAVKRLKEALFAHVKALAMQPGNPAIMTELAVTLGEAGQAGLALALINKVLGREPHFAAALKVKADMLCRGNNSEAAFEAYTEALAHNPEDADLHNTYGNLLAGMNKPAAAIAHYNTAISLEPNKAVSYRNLGGILNTLMRYDEAAVKYKYALALEPDCIEAMHGLGLAYCQQGFYDQAIAVFHEAIQLNANDINSWLQMAACYRELQQDDNALECYDEAIRLQPDNADAHYGKAVTLLSQGVWDEGFKHYEYRRQINTADTPRDFAQPQWDGTEQPGKTLLVYAGQGLGDTVQFIRLASMARARVGKVVAEVQPALCRLLRFSLPDIEFVARGESPPDFDIQAPLMSLPGLLGITEACLPVACNYIMAKPDRVKIWDTFLSGKPGLRIGLHWQGNPVTPGDNKGRSIPLRLFAPLFEIPDTRFISLQKNDGLEQIAGLTPEQQANLQMLGDDFDSGRDAFLDAVAVMANLDLIITSDNAMAHLAGALGRPCWLLLKKVPDWRWLQQREDSPWYPSMRLFRQKNENCWQALIPEIESALKEVLV